MKTAEDLKRELDQKQWEKLGADSAEMLALLRGANALVREQNERIALLDRKADNSVSSSRRAEVAADGAASAVQRLEIEVRGCRSDVAQMNAAFARLEDKLDQVLTHLGNSERFTVPPSVKQDETKQEDAATGARGAE